MSEAVAMIPARAGSKRIKNKNTRTFEGHPLIAYAIRSAVDSGVFRSVIVSTEDPQTANIARYYGAEVPFLRPEEYATDLSPDIEWVEYTLNRLREEGLLFDCFALLRPTSPFRTADTIRRAWQAFQCARGVDSLRAVELCAQHPCKMWIIRGKRMVPLISFGPPDQPWHSSPYQALPEVYVQNASLEIAWTRVVFETRTIAGHVVMPFITKGHEGFDLNTPEDWLSAERLVEKSETKLPCIRIQSCDEENL